MSRLVPENHPALHEIAQEIPDHEIGSPKIRKVLRDMETALLNYKAEGFVGIAIAAPQIGVPLRIFLIHDMSKDRKHALPSIVAINPKIIKTSKQTNLAGEGCLSVPERYGAVERANKVTLRAKDERGKEFERGASGLLAQIFQHECDHLDGTLFTDRATKVWTKEEMDDQTLEEMEYTG